MDPPPPPPSNAAPTITKLRLMCSYSGHITRRPRTKSLSYLGGETRIISVDPTTVNTLSTFISHLLTILPIKPPFSLKYHLPHSALDSLISLSSSDDLHFMFSEHLRLSSSSSSSSRIRLFLFFPEPEKPHNVIHHPKTEAWFSDALKSAKILQKGRDCLVGFDGEGLIGENEVKGIVDLGNGGFSLPESMVLETSSSFGSSSSSASLANVSPPIKPQSEDFGLSSVASDSVATLASDIPPTNSCSSVENGVTSVPVITESNFHNLAAGVRSRNPHDFSGYARPNLFQHQELQFVQPSIPVESCLPVVYQMPSYYPVQQPQFVHYQPMPNHMYPVYYLPVGQTQVSAPSNLPVQAPVGQTQVSAPSNLPVQAPVGQTQISAPSNLPVQAPVGQTQISAPSNLPVQAPVGQTQISALSNLPVQAPVGQTQISAPSNLPVKAPVGQTQISAPSNLPVQAPVGQTQISAPSNLPVQAPVGQTQISAPSNLPVQAPVGQTQISALFNLPVQAPVGQTQVSTPSNLPMQWGLHNTATAISTHSLVLPDASPVVPLPQVAYKEMMPELHSQNHGAMPSLANPTSLESADEVQQHPVIIPNDVAADASSEVGHTCDEYNEDDPTRTLIYKSQPLPPLQSKPRASTNLLSDAMAQLQMIKINQ